MKKGKLFGGNKNIFVFIFLLLLAALILVGFFSGFFGKITTLNVRNLGINITVGGPQIIAVYNGTAGFDLNSAESASLSINFTVYDGADAKFLNDSTATVNVSFINEVTRTTTNCSRQETGTNYANFTCNITLWWYDSAGSWNISAYILDNSSNVAINSSSTKYINALTGFNIAPVNLTWSAFAPGATNQTANNDPLNLTNTGNQAFGNASGNISVNSTNLLGETNTAFALYASNFTISTITGGTCTGAGCTECGNASGSHLAVGNYKNISTSFLPRGNYTIGDTTTGREQLYYCLRTSGFDLITQAYSTKGGGLWTVMIS